MSNRTLAITDEIYQYMLDANLREPAIFRALREETARLADHDCQIAPEQGQFMAVLLELMGARRVLEIGTFTGYSALWIASALPAEGRLICCDVSDEWTAVARRYWAEAGLGAKIELRLAPAVQTIDALLARENAGGTFDFVFVDADKESYDAYYEGALRLLRPGGLIAIDNAFSEGRVVRPAPEQANVRAIDALNRKVHRDERVSASLVPIADGLLLARKRA